MARATLGLDTTTSQRTLLIASAYGMLHMHITCIGVAGDWSDESVAPCTIGVTTGAELVSLNLLTIP